MPNARIYWLHALSPTHVGTGRGVGYIDLPIDRDKVTGWPIIRGSGFKGVWADYYAQKVIPTIEEGQDRRKLDTPESRLLKAAFGVSSSKENESNSGALIPTDAKLVCLPVRSFRGTFAWATSALCLRMLQRTLKLLQMPGLPTHIPTPKEPEEKTKSPGEAFCVNETLVEQGNVYLEDLDFKAVTTDTVTKEWAEFIAKSVFSDDTDWQEQFKKRFVVLPDSEFDFLCETGTEVNTRVKISDEMKVVEKGALWTEESLPSETILMGVIQCERVFQKNGSNDASITPDRLLAEFATKPLTLQIGGKATVGRGQMRCVFTEVKG